MPTSEEFQTKYKQLNSEQKNAVDTTEGPVMVLAGPGTGKTQTLAMRIANILRQTQMDPWNILCLTFTESGVAAMRTRLLSIIGAPAYYVRIHTFHSFCNDIIKDHPELFALSSSWHMLSDIERVELLRDSIDVLPGTSRLKPFGDPYLYIRDVSGNIKQLKQEDCSPEQFQQVLEIIQLFVSETKKHAATFFTLKPKERTGAACDAFIEVLTVSATHTHLPESLVLMIVRLHQKYSDHNAAAEDSRSQGKSRTMFKNDIKKWYDKLAGQLPRQLDMAKVYKRYQEALGARGRYDYEDMIMMVVSELKKNDELLASYQEQFQYILVDEYQDTNGAQNEVVGLLSSFDDNPNVFVVGDDKQSIYRFQGASLNNMLDFYEKYKERVVIIPLKENYRSQSCILDAAGAVIAHNNESITKYIPNIVSTLSPAAGRRQEKLSIQVFDSEDAEDYGIAKHVQGLIARGSQPQDIAVLFRYNRDGIGLMRVMQRLAIPARLEAGENIFDDICINQMISLMTYLTDMHREDLLAEILQFDWLALPALDTLKVIMYAGAQRLLLLSLIGDEANLHKLGVSNPALFTVFKQQLADWKRNAANTTLQDFLHQIFTESGWLTYVVQQSNKLPTLQKMTRLLQEVKQLNTSNHTLTMSEFIRRLQLLREHDVPLETQPWQTAFNAVRLMTAHKAKGLEFEHVVISRLNNKHWGNNPDVSKLPLPHGLIHHDFIIAEEHNEDERRLLYVALTRAKQTLYLTRAKYSEQGRPTVPSIFLHEIPIELADVQQHTENEDELVERIVTGSVKKVPDVTQDGIKTWLRLVLQNHVLSVTHLNNYLECPRKFYIKNVLRVPSVRTPHQALGSAVHGALESFFAEFEKSGMLPSVQVLVLSFEHFLQREVLTAQQAKHAVDIGRNIVQEYYAQYKDSFKSDTKREYNFASHGITISGIPITGLIDKIELIDPNDKQSDGLWRKGAKVNIVDYKTGKPENGLRKLSQGGDYYRQLVFYKLLCDESPRFPFTFATAEIDFVQKSEVKGFIKKQFTITDDEVTLLKKEIQNVWDQIQNLAFFEAEAGCGKPSCEYCK